MRAFDALRADLAGHGGIGEVEELLLFCLGHCLKGLGVRDRGVERCWLPCGMPLQAEHGALA